MQQPVFMAIDALEFPELHDESIPAMAFVKALSRLMMATGVKDFTLKVRGGWRTGAWEGSLAEVVGRGLAGLHALAQRPRLAANSSQT